MNKEYVNDNQPLKLWNRNFIILVFGSLVSMMGYNIANYAMGLLVLDETESVFFYALVMVVSMLPRIIVPMIAGTFFDRHSRRRAIYTLDYCYTTIFLLVGLSLHFGFFNYWLYLVVGLLIGTMDGIYMVAFDSVFPLLTTRATSTKAYSINSLLFPISASVSIPFTVLGYESIGAETLFFASCVLFFLTANFETLIKVREPHLVPYQPDKQRKLPASPKERELVADGVDLVEHFRPRPRSRFIDDFKEGIKYLRGEKGLTAITLYFCVCAVAGAMINTLMLPYFRTGVKGGLPGYLVVGGGMMVGRLLGGTLHYRMKIVARKKYGIACMVYLLTNVAYMLVFHMPLWLMAVIMLIDGMLSITSYNIRISSTQNYVPDMKRGRFNGTFMFFNMTGNIIGQLLAGILGDAGLSIPWIVTSCALFNFIAVFVIVMPNKKHISAVYNQVLK